MKLADTSPNTVYLAIVKSMAVNGATARGATKVSPQSAQVVNPAMTPTNMATPPVTHCDDLEGDFTWVDKRSLWLQHADLKVKSPDDLQDESRAMDVVDAVILAALRADARLSMARLAKRVGMSAPGVTERVRRLEEAGAIRGFTVDIDPRAFGYAIRALVRIRPLPGKLHLVERLIQNTPQIVECDKITGDDPFLARLVVRSIEEMDGVLEALSEHATTSTAVVKGRSVEARLPPLP